MQKCQKFVDMAAEYKQRIKWRPEVAGAHTEFESGGGRALRHFSPRDQCPEAVLVDHLYTESLDDGFHRGTNAGQVALPLRQGCPPRGQERAHNHIA